ncbi:MAG: hypothetical protein PHI64_01095 [Zoogloea sp.]|uniref:hypothetical protein n=1 Tax=Zoogloea sp. TaxID=49181 RepID=UPI0026371877|nr:hypothetical protein [Zoogloea sp.]MDD2987531.1 hypothetical protein [Zoogloea sp.]
MSVDAADVSRSLGTTLNKYIEGEASFTQLETALAASIRAVPTCRDVFNQLYHVVSHYEIDADLRTEDPQYQSIMIGKLRQIAVSLVSGSPDSLGRSIAAFWKS